MTKDSEQLVLFLLAICIVSFVKYPLKYCATSKKKQVAFLLQRLESSLCNLGKCLLSNICIRKCFLPIFGLCFHFLSVYFKEHKFLMFIISALSVWNVL